MTIINTTNGGGVRTIAGEEKPSSFPSTYPAPEGYDGWSKLTIDAPDNLTGDNIKKDVEIAGVKGTYEPSLTAQEGTITEFPMTYATPEGFYGMSTVIAHAPETLVAGNIKKGVEVANITGTYEPALQMKGTKATSFPVVVEPDADYYGLEQATVTAPENLSAENIKNGVAIAGVEGTYETPTQEKTLKPEIFPTDVTPDAGYALSKVSVTSPDNLTAENIKKGVDIAGVKGTFEYVSQEKTETAEAFPVEVTPDGGYDGLSSVTVTAPATLIPENIKKDINISGVTGTYEGSGGSVLTFGTNGRVKTPSVLTPDMFEGTTTIDYEAFKNWWNITSVTLPDTVKTLASDCFNGCIYLTSVTLPEGLTKLESSCFTNCVSLPSINIPNSVTLMDTSCFASCGKLASVNIPTGVTSVGARCFYYCTSLTSITIPENVTSIGNYCFGYCSGLTSVTLPKYLTKIATYCFQSCTSLPSITIPDRVETLSSYCFYNCQSLTSITIPASVTSIESGCFYGCSKLASVVMLPTTPPTLGSSVFNNTSSDLVITVPKGTLDAYKAATNWSAYADKMVEASE